MGHVGSIGICVFLSFKKLLAGNERMDQWVKEITVYDC